MEAQSRVVVTLIFYFWVSGLLAGAPHHKPGSEDDEAVHGSWSHWLMHGLQHLLHICPTSLILSDRDLTLACLPVKIYPIRQGKTRVAADRLGLARARNGPSGSCFLFGRFTSVQLLQRGTVSGSRFGSSRMVGAAPVRISVPEKITVPAALARFLGVTGHVDKCFIRRRSCLERIVQQLCPVVRFCGVHNVHVICMGCGWCVYICACVCVHMCFVCICMFIFCSRLARFLTYAFDSLSPTLSHVSVDMSY